MSKRVKNLLAKELVDGLGESDSCVVVGVGRMDVLTATALRRNLRDEGLKLRVLKNRVAAHAMKDRGWGDIGDLFSGPSALAYGEGGALAASKILVDWEKRLPDAMSIRGGLIDGQLIDVDGVRHLATIPDKPTLYAMIAAAVVAPVSSVASLVGDVMAGVARAVGAVAEKQSEDAE